MHFHTNLTIRLMHFLTRFRNVLLIVLILGACYLIPTCQKSTPELIHLSQDNKKNTMHRQQNATFDCQKLSYEMQQITPQRTTFALEQMNKYLGMCLPDMDLAQKKDIMLQSSQMYTQFLTINRTPEQQKAFETYVVDKAQIPNIQQTFFEQLNQRDQYLLRHYGQGYLEIVETNDGHLIYRRSPRYLAKFFAPFFPEAEKVFMQELAQQNKEPLLSNNKFKISAQEITRRALFWENYLKHYPNSSYRKDALYLLKFYSMLLFIGTDIQPVSALYADHLDIQISNFMEIEALAKQRNSQLADQSRKFLKFIEMDEERRMEDIPLTQKAINNASNSAHDLAVAQLAQFLGLTPISLQELEKTDCFSDAICHKS